MTQKSKHLKYRKMAFSLTVPESLFSESERELLIEYGAWLAALMRGSILPQTSKQIRFVCVCKGEAKPDSIFEKVWIKYINRKKWEEQNLALVGAKHSDVSCGHDITGKGWGKYGCFR